MDHRIYCNDKWYFTEEYSDELLKSDCISQLTEVRIPHTVKELPYHYFDEKMYQMLSGYVKLLEAPKEWEGKKVILTFEGVGHQSEVFINGKSIKTHNCGYTAFSVDLSEHLMYGSYNLLTVKVDSRESLNVPPFGFVIDYMTYGGIYRDVYLEVFENENIEDIFVYSVIQDENLNKRKETENGFLCDVEIKGEIKVSEEAKMLSNGKLKIALIKDGKEEILVDSIGINENKFSVKKQVLLWDLDHPNLYDVKFSLLENDALLQEKIVNTGFRKADFRSDGFYLNGKKTKIRGLNRHQCYPYVGYAMPKRMQENDAELCKYELGVNAVRTSHYPQSHDFIHKCDELGLMVFTEMPGWQHIGDAKWKDQAVQNTKDMVSQYRNHPSIIIWGVRINESRDDDEFYIRTNEAAHALDPSRPTGGVRNFKKSHLYEDVYTYNDFVHDGKKPGCEPKKKVTSDMNKPYLISEYNGHMYPTKAYDWEEHRVEHALRHVRVLDTVAGEENISGSFGWCMFDYNTHKDFGSGDRICYHGVMDMFRNEKLASLPYMCYRKDPVLDVSSAFDIGEHPGCNRGETYIFANADSVKMYKNGRFIKEYFPEDTPYKNMSHGPILIDDYIGDSLKMEKVTPKQEKILKKAFNTVARTGISNIPLSVYWAAFRVVAFHGLKAQDGIDMYTRQIGDWGGESTVYKFEAIKDGQVIKTVTKEPMLKKAIEVSANTTVLEEDHTYDVAAIRIRMVDQNGNLLNFSNDPVKLSVEGPVELIGPDIIALQGGMFGTYLKTTGNKGKAKLTVSADGAKDVTIEFDVK